MPKCLASKRDPGLDQRHRVVERTEERTGKERKGKERARLDSQDNFPGWPKLHAGYSLGREIKAVPQM